MQHNNKLLILSPFEMPDAKLALATIKGGAFPILHLGRDIKRAQSELDFLSSKTDQSFGICIVSEEMKDLVLPKNVTKVLLPLGISIPLKKGMEILYQVHSFEEIEEAVEKGNHSVILKGSESAGKVSNESSFILFQKVMQKYADTGRKVYVQGGVGIHSSAAFLALGAEGVILDSQVALFPECSTPREIKEICRKLSGSETILVDNFRVLYRNTSPQLPHDAKQKDIQCYLGGFDLSANYLPMGQDIALSIDLVERYKKLSNFISHFFEVVRGHLVQAKNQKGIFPENDLARDLGIKYPIAQGPMARISDVPEFINNVAEAGGLPFFAMSLMHGEKAQELIKSTADLLKDKPWGIGIMGFVPPQLREVQTQHILEAKPSVVLIAGGRPSLAKPFEKEGIKVFLHVPSSALLDMFLKEGAKNFIFEGRESGGHVGPLFSLILWEKQITRLLAIEDDRSSISVFFAGGIHDAFSSAFVSIMSAPLSAKGVKVGVLMGTSYLYTQEAVKSGAIVAEYQKQLIKKDRTVLLETAMGQETRSVETAFTDFFVEEKKRLLSQNIDSSDVWMKLENLNMGSLRIAAKGIERKDDKLVKLTKKDQLEKGLYMTGEVTSLTNAVTTIADLHHEVAVNSNKLLGELVEPKRVNSKAKPLDIAIVGMEGVFPDAKNIEEYWRNILNGKDCMTEVPDTRWNKELFYNPDTRDTDYVCSKRGGFIPTIDFDPLEFGMTPQSLASIEPVQLLSLYIAKKALEDAGYSDLSQIDTDYVSVIFGAEGATELATQYSLRTGAKQLFGELPDEVKKALPRLNSDSFAGVLSNVIAGRIANRLNLGGRNFTVDAACASSSAALDVACQELCSHRSDMVLVGGADFHNGINDFLMFGSTYALSKKGFCATFDAESDGIALGEGIGVLILKRLEDAERDGNKIYAVIKGIGGSSDGKNLGMTAPSHKGQLKALDRAYQSAGILPTEVGLIEAHGTGTVVGDRAELAALNDLFLESGSLVRQTYLGSVKTQIGHTKCAAGIAGVIRATFAVQHGIIPPTIHLNKPLGIYDSRKSPFKFNAKAGLWTDERRIAGISAFGFGGTNFHTVIENYVPEVPETNLQAWSAELFVFRGETMEEAHEQIRQVKELITLNDNLKLKDIAYSLVVCENKDIQISLLAGTIQQLSEKLDIALSGEKGTGIFYRDVKEGKVAFLFSGQGSQKVNMARDLFVAFPRMRKMLLENKEYENILFPETVFDEEERNAQKQRITETQNAQPLLGIVDFAIADFLKSLDIVPDMVAGHSYGELAAACFAGAFSPEQLPMLSRKRAESILNAIEDDKGLMVAVSLPQDDLEDLLKEESEVWAVNFNSNKQVVLAGTTAGMNAFMEKMSEKGIAHKQINVACAFHSPLLHKSKDLYAEVLKTIKFKKPTIKIWSNTTANLYPAKAKEIKDRLCEQLIKPVLFSEQLKNMYADGARIFIETGPGRVLTGLVQSTLDADVVTIPTEGNFDGIAFLLEAIARYVQAGKKVNLEKLFEGRNPVFINISEPEEYKKHATIWHINGHNAVPSVGKLPAGAASVLSEPILLIKDMENSKNITADKIMLEYLQNMREAIQDQRDVMLSYMGQVEVLPRTVVRTSVPLEVQQVQQGQQMMLQQQPAEVQTAEIVTTNEEPQLDLASLTMDDLKEIILDIVSDKTGYPVDMLGMDMDLEADLSIDSIKRMEIIAALREKLNFSDEIDASEEALEKMASIKTLNAMIAWIEELVKNPEKKTIQVSGSEDAAVDAEVVQIEESTDTELSRMCFELRPYPIKKENAVSIDKMKFAITNEGTEVTESIKKALESNGAVVDIVNAKDELSAYDGLVVLNINASPIHYTMKDLFQLTKTADMDKMKWIFAFSDFTGSILANGSVKGIKKLQGFSGFLKTLAHEYPKVYFRNIDSRTAFDTSLLPEIVSNELLVEDKSREIVYNGDERLRFEACLKKLEVEESVETSMDMLDSNSVLLVLGGAQGITPELMSKLSVTYPCNLVLVGRSPMEKEDEGYALLKTKENIRQYLIAIEEMKVPAEIEKKVQQIYKSQQIHKSIKKIEEAGGKVTYKSADVKNIKGFKALIKEIRQEYGKIDGVIHAAGILEDKLFNQKEWKSFEQVYQTKVNPLHVIIDELLPELKLLILFSSVSSTFGNRGQADYAAGNSVLDTASMILSEKEKNLKVLSFNWGPWKGAGMVSSGLETEFKKRNVSFIPLKEGSEVFVNELKYGKDPLVLIMGGKTSDMENFLEFVQS